MCKVSECFYKCAIRGDTRVVVMIKIWPQVCKEKRDSYALDRKTYKEVGGKGSAH